MFEVNWSQQKLERVRVVVLRGSRKLKGNCGNFSNTRPEKLDDGKVVDIESIRFGTGLARK